MNSNKRLSFRLILIFLLAAFIACSDKLKDLPTNISVDEVILTKSMNPQLSHDIKCNKNEKFKPIKFTCRVSVQTNKLKPFVRISGKANIVIGYNEGNGSLAEKTDLLQNKTFDFSEQAKKNRDIVLRIENEKIAKDYVLEVKQNL